MKTAPLLLLSVVAAGCAGTQARRDRDMAPYKAVLIFEWPEPEPPAGAPAPTKGEVVATQALDRHDVEQQIFRSLLENRVFSGLIQAENWNAVPALLEKEKADLILRIRIRSLARWDAEESSIDPGIAILNAVLWFGTAIGGWWVPDREFTTTSDIEVAWKRLEPTDVGTGNDRRPVDLREDFKSWERVSSGTYSLSFWERAKVWSAPMPYLLNIVIPPPLVPLQDDEEVDRSLIAEALDDVTREMAQILNRRNLGAAGAPFRFRLEEPVNGAPLETDSTVLQYRYDPEAGHKGYELTLLKALTIHLKRGDEEYQLLREYKDETIRDVNAQIKAGTPLQVKIDDLVPGCNLVQFAAETQFGGWRITNTVALMRQ